MYSVAQDGHTRTVSDTWVLESLKADSVALVGSSTAGEAMVIRDGGRRASAILPQFMVAAGMWRPFLVDLWLGACTVMGSLVVL